MWISTGQRAIAGVISLLVFGVSAGRAQEVVTVPSEYETMDASSNNCIPLGLDCFGAGASARHQQIYAADEFAGASGVIDDVSAIGIGATLGQGVSLGQEVEIELGVAAGADTAIDRATLVRRYTVIGQQTGIGHNVRVGMKSTIADGAVVPDNESIPNNGIFP